MSISEEAQLKTCIKTSTAKLEFKLTKQRSLSKQSLHSVTLSLRELSQVDVKSRQFERGLGLVKVRLAELVRADRVADVWEELLGELGVLGLTYNSLIALKLLEKEKEKEKGKVTEKEDGKSKKEPSATTVIELSKVEKVARNIIVVSSFIGNEVKELRKLSYILGHIMGKEFTDKCNDIDDLINEVGYKDDDSALDLEDRVFVEVLRKLRGEGEENVVEQYLEEICNGYRIDLFKEGKYDDEKLNETEVNNQDEAGKGINITTNETSKSTSTDLDDLKKRFEALKRT